MSSNAPVFSQVLVFCYPSHILFILKLSHFFFPLFYNSIKSNSLSWLLPPHTFPALLTFVFPASVKSSRYSYYVHQDSSAEKYKVCWFFYVQKDLIASMTCSWYSQDLPIQPHLLFQALASSLSTQSYMED